MDSQEAIQLELAEALATVKAQPSSVRARDKLAELYLQANQPEEAREVYSALAEEHVSREQVSAGAAVYKKMLRALPQALTGPGHKRLGELYHGLERLQEAAEHWLLYADRCEDDDLLDDATYALEQVDRISPLAIPARIRLAEHYASLERMEEAVQAYEQVLERLEEQAYWSDYTKAANRLLVLAPHHLNTRKMLARVALEKGEVMESVRHLQQAFRIDRRDPETLEMLSLAFDFLGQEKKALSILKELADVFEEQEQYARARALYRKILERDPSSVTAIESLTHLQVLTGLKSAEKLATPTAIGEPPAKESALAGGTSEAHEAIELPPPPPTSAEEAPTTDPPASTVEQTSAAPREAAPDAVTPAPPDTPKNEAGPAPEEAPEFALLRQELQHSNVPAKLVSTAMLQAIVQRPSHPGRSLKRWPGKLRRRLDGELLYEERYLVTDYLGKGLLGKTFRAIDVFDPARFVCIKRPYFEEFDEEQEAEVVALFTAQATPLLERAHPHLVRVLAVGQSELGYPYMITEYFHGASLAEQKQTLTPASICEVWYRLVHTLLYLQSVGAVHGNLNPKNILFDKQGAVQVCDAGFGQLRAELDELNQISSIWQPQASLDSLTGVTGISGIDGGHQAVGTRGFLAPELLDGSAPTQASEVFALGALLYYMATHTAPPWGKKGTGELTSPALTRNPSEDTPRLPFEDDPHGAFLQELFPSLVAYDPSERLSLREIQRKYVKLVVEAEEASSGELSAASEEGSVPSGSFEVGNTAHLRRSPMFRVEPIPTQSSPIAQSEPVAVLATEEIAPEASNAEVPGLSVPDTDPVNMAASSPEAIADVLQVPQETFVVADTVGETHKPDATEEEEPEHPKWSDVGAQDTASRLPPLAAPPIATNGAWVPQPATMPDLSLLRVPAEASPRAQLPSACASLPAETQDLLVQLHHRMKGLSLFSGKGDPLLGVEFLHEHVIRLQAFSDFPLQARISYVHTNWHTLERHLATQEEVDEIAKKASARILKEDPTNLDRAGQIAWSAIDQFTFSQSRLLPFKTAITAVSGIGWSPDQASEWSAAMTAAKAKAKHRAQEAGRLTSWNAAKSMAWCAVWPLAKAAAVRAFHPLAHAAAWPISWDASWHTAWVTLQDLPGVERDPFEPLFAVWEMGLYPLQMHDGEILLIILDPRASDQFQLVQVAT